MCCRPMHSPLSCTVFYIAANASTLTTGRWHNVFFEAVGPLKPLVSIHKIMPCCVCDLSQIKLKQREVVYIWMGRCVSDVWGWQLRRRRRITAGTNAWKKLEYVTGDMRVNLNERFIKVNNTNGLD